MTSLADSAPHFGEGISTSQLWSVLNAAPSGMALLTAVRSPENPELIVDFRYRLANQAHAAVTPFSFDELPGMRVSALFPTLAQHPFFTQFADAIRTQQPSRSEHMYQADGLDGWFSVRVAPSGDDLILTYDDITDAQRAQADAQRHAQELRAIFDASINSIIAMTAIRDEQHDIIDFRMDMANESVLKSNFMKPEQIIGRRLLVVFPGNRDNGFFDLYRRVMATGIAEESTQYYRDDFGLEGWFEVSAVRQSPNQLVVTYNNVTGIKRQELELQRTNERLVQINDSALSGIAAYTAIREPGPDGQPGPIIDFVYDSFNRRAEELTGLKASDMVGNRVVQLFPHVKTSGLFDKWVQLVETGEPMRYTSFYNGQGKELWYDTQAVKWSDGFIQSYIDISASVTYQRGLEQANQVLRQANENLQQFAYVASHDLQEPLRKIVTICGLLIEQYADALGADGHDLLIRVHRSAQRMTVLVKDLLAYSRLATPEVVREPVDLNLVLSDVLTDLDQLIAEHSAVINADSLPTLQADSRQLQQLLQNLLSNAIKYVQPGTTPQVHIRSTLHSREALALLLTPPESSTITAPAYYELTITDNGIGFRPEYRDRIFGTFQRLHTASSPYEGTGIGLAIVKRVAENHGAFVIADSEEGKGATFRVFWPAESINV
ncbi:PAS/PAC sensor signal transduction histidine kinase [Fibrella aestuarina BUZ 2]|uniref:histidine kinase n=1 Tax=Fibrella aestuarina BUZ 2 TaxID=1166018 RepID=I0KBG8_9BACT|nr:ATP-binding protein [Fibrella aestuarina]CCH01471.1 PAS/PAC sensor signal transduction histidine kinase [Fibrella aestuarina BUZ 2]